MGDNFLNRYQVRILYLFGFLMSVCGLMVGMVPEGDLPQASLFTFEEVGKTLNTDCPFGWLYIGTGKDGSTWSAHVTADVSEVTLPDRSALLHLHFSFPNDPKVFCSKPHQTTKESFCCSCWCRVQRQDGSLRVMLVNFPHVKHFDQMPIIISFGNYRSFYMISPVVSRATSPVGDPDVKSRTAIEALEGDGIAVAS